MAPRTFVVVGAGAGATVLAAAGITYALTVGSSPAASSVHRAARPVHRVAQPARRTVPVVAPSADRNTGGARSAGRDGGGRGRGEDGRIYFNERVYSASVDGCVTAASGLGASSFSVFNDSRRTIEVFRGFTCDNGAPVATVGPHGETYGVVTRTDHGGDFGDAGVLFGDDGVVGSFRVVCDHDE
ncbi:hypothetical protein [Streptomyces sp. NPDC046759]|uniref:hypothetical protein n=1 Tax=Streptomyces sp. NPDC046759 TaxID=3155019 RepID=UPI0033C5FA1E